jgi:predicted metalloendopeptidase
MNTTIVSRSIMRRTTLLAALVAGIAGLAWPQAKPVGIDLEGMDRAVAPGDDFFRYANGSWLRATEIPPDRGGYGAAVMVVDRVDERTAALIRDTASSDAAPGSDARKIADFYASYMDAEGIEAKGLEPLRPTLDRIAAIADRRSLARLLGATLRADVDVFNSTNLYTDNLFGLWVAQDLDDPSRYVPFLLQGGLDMPDRAYYVDPSPRMADVREQCQAHMARVFELAGVTEAKAAAARVFDLERRIAQAHVSRQDSEDVQKGHNRWTRGEFDTRAPGLDWGAYFEEAGLSDQRDFVVWQPSAVIGLSALAADQPLEAWKDYLVFHAIDHHSAFLPEAFGAERFAFHGKALTGTPQRRERAKRGVDATNFALGEAVGRLYVQKYFPPAAKARVQEIVARIQAAFGRRIDALPWMAASTKAKAKAKLAVLKVGVGYPDRWRDYGPLAIVRGDALGNAQRVELFEYREALARRGRPVDRSEWVMTPQTVNAVNLPALNAMNFPAAILEPPFFDPARPLAMDYGAIGATIGHEISHSFDDQGAQFDDTGRLRNWWTKEDLEHFHGSAAKLVKQYDAYRPFSDVAVNGTLTLSENIADVAGLAAAYDAYQASLQGRPAPVVAGLTGDQQFFLSYAQSWRTKMREALLRQRIVGDSHAPDEYRADAVRNLDAWYAAFGVKPGQALYLAPGERVRVW